MRVLFRSPWRHRGLIGTLSWRDIALRYRGAFLGVLWPVLTPLLMLAVYTLVFGVVFATRWPGRVVEGGIGLFALMLLSGLLLLIGRWSCRERVCQWV